MSIDKLTKLNKIKILFNLGECENGKIGVSSRKPQQNKQLQAATAAEMQSLSKPLQ